MNDSDPHTNVFYSNTAELSKGSGESSSVESQKDFHKKSSQSLQEVCESREKFSSSEFGYEGTKNGQFREEISDSGEKNPDLLLRSMYSTPSLDPEVMLNAEPQATEELIVSTERKLMPGKADLSYYNVEAGERFSDHST